MRYRQLNRLNLQQVQEHTLQCLITQALGSDFAVDHELQSLSTYAAYRQQMPLSSAESLWQKYLVQHPGNFDGRLTWGPVHYLAHTSGSSMAQEKYMPVTPLFLKHMRQAAFWQGLLNVLRCSSTRQRFSMALPWLWLTDLSDYFRVQTYPTAMISRITREGMGCFPRILPNASFFQETSEDARFHKLVTLAIQQPLGGLSGITPWLLRFCEQALAQTQKQYLHEIWPQLQFILHAGVDFSPYRQRFELLMDRPVHFVESYVATEGFLGIQELHSPLLRCLPQQGIFYEFIPFAQFHESCPPRYGLWEVETGIPYAVVVSNFSGFWSVPVGDLVIFEQTTPYPLFRVVGRTQQKCDFFGEKLLLSEIQAALQTLSAHYGVPLHHFAVGPHAQERRLTVLVEFAEQPAVNAEVDLDRELRTLNRQYARNRQRQIHDAPQVLVLVPGSFQRAFETLNPQHVQRKPPQLFQTPEALLRFVNSL